MKYDNIILLFLVNNVFTRVITFQRKIILLADDNKIMIFHK